MIPYESLPFFREENSTLPHLTEDLEKGFSLLNLDFAFSDITNILQGDYQMCGNSQALLNIMGNRDIAGNLFYCQFFSIVDVNYGYYTRRENVDSFELRYTLGGSGILEYRGKKYTLREGEGFFISSMEPHYYYANREGWKCTIFHINGKLCQQYFHEFASCGSVKFSEQSIPAFESLQFQVLKATQKITPYMRYRVSCALDLLLTELLNSSAQNTSSDSFDDDIIAKVIAYLREHYEEKIVFESLAREFGTSRSVLFIKFKQYTGYTPTAYLTEIRLTQAKLLLRATSLSIEQIATQSGFQDAGYFSQVFKKNIGTTPLKFRKQ